MKTKTVDVPALDLDFGPDQEGDVRIAREDSRNFVVQRLTKIESKDKDRKPTGEFRLEWVTAGYYGERPEALIAAARGAIAMGATGNSAKDLIDTIQRTEKRVLADIAKLLGKESK
jgi:hypothetical protein